MLEGAHFLTRERGPEVSQLLRHIILHGAAHCSCIGIMAVHMLGWQALPYCCPTDTAKQQKGEFFASQDCLELPAAAPVVPYHHRGVEPRWGRERAQC